MVPSTVSKMAIDTMQKQKKNSVPATEETELKKTIMEDSQI